MKTLLNISTSNIWSFTRSYVLLSWGYCELKIMFLYCIAFSLKTIFLSQYDIAKTLQISQPTICRDIQYLREMARDDLMNHFDEKIAEGYQRSLTSRIELMIHIYITHVHDILLVLVLPVVLYPVTYPPEQTSKYIYFESPYTGTDHQGIRLAREYHIYVDTKIPITNDETLLMMMKVYKKLGIDGKPIIQFRIQYQSVMHDTVIRADNYEPFPHIDIEPYNNLQKKQIKNIFDTDPSDYEAGVNTVLRYAERMCNRRIGIEYWLRNLVEYDRELVYSIFDSKQTQTSINSSHADVARLVSFELLTHTQDVVYSNTDLSNMVERAFSLCKQYEIQHHRPLKIHSNLVWKHSNESLMPFPIIAYSGISKWYTCFDSNADEVPCNDGKILGKASYRR
jgi:hypothetical protein